MFRLNKMSGGHNEPIEVNPPRSELVKHLKSAIDRERTECLKAQDSVNKYISRLSRLDKQIRDKEMEITDRNSKVQELQEEYRKVHEKIARADWMRWKAALVLKSDAKKRQLMKKEMEKMHECFVNMTTEEATSRREIEIAEGVERRIIELTEKRDTLKIKLEELKTARDEDAAKLGSVNANIMARKKRNNAIVLRLRGKLTDSEAARTQVLEQLNNFKKLK